MTPRVDASAGAVVDGDDTWSLRLDGRTGGAVLSIGDRDIEVRPMQWRHKQRLARWAHLGQQLVATQRAALAVEPGTTLDEHERALVDAVVAFLEGDSLPFDPALLAEVAFETCRATGLAPAAFDDRDAAEVEMMWRTVSTPVAPVPLSTGGSPEARASAPDPWADANSIVFTPTVTAGTPRRFDAWRESEEQPAAHPVSGARASADAATDDRPPGTSDDAERAIEAGRPTRRREASRHRIVPAVPRHSAIDPPAPGAADRRLPLPATSGAVTSPPAPAPDATTSDGRRMRGADDALEIAAPARATGVDPGATGALFGPTIPGPMTHRPVPAAGAPPSPPAPVTPTGDDLDALAVAMTDRLVEQLAEQLSDAADDLGIEV